MLNVSNPAAFGVEWTSGDNGRVFQLANPRGTTSLIFGARDATGGDPWMSTPVVAPERFGLTEPPKTFKEFRAIAEAYVNG